MVELIPPVLVGLAPQLLHFRLKVNRNDEHFVAHLVGYFKQQSKPSFTVLVPSRSGHLISYNFFVLVGKGIAKDRIGIAKIDGTTI